MEYFEFLTDFFNQNEIDFESVPVVTELFEIFMNISFLLEDNNNIKEIYSKDNINNLRNEFIKDQIKKLNIAINNFSSLKSMVEGNHLKVVNTLIEFCNKTMKKLNDYLSIPNKDNESLVFRHENNRKRVLINLNKKKELEEKLRRKDKTDLIQNLSRVMLNLVNIYRFGSNPSLSEIKSKINKIFSYLDLDYLREINELNIEELIKDKDKERNKEQSLKYLNDLYMLNAHHQKPIIDTPDLLKIRELEERIYSLSLFNYLEKSSNNDELKTYYVLLKGQLEVLYIDVDNIEKRKIYLTTLSNMLNTITSLNEKLKPLKVSNGIFDYNVENFDSVKTIKTDGNRKWIRYKKGNVNNYSLIENRETITRELDYWKKEMNSGFDRWDKGDFYKDVEETFNFIKLYYKYRVYIMYLEVSNKLFQFKDSSKMINKDKNVLNELKDYLMKKIENLRIRGISEWKKEIDPERYFAKLPKLNRRVIIESIIPKDGIGRCIESSEMLKIIYGEAYVVNNISSFERKTDS